MSAEPDWQFAGWQARLLAGWVVFRAKVVAAADSRKPLEVVENHLSLSRASNASKIPLPKVCQCCDQAHCSLQGENANNPTSLSERLAQRIDSSNRHLRERVTRDDST